MKIIFSCIPKNIDLNIDFEMMSFKWLHGCEDHDLSDTLRKIKPETSLKSML